MSHVVRPARLFAQQAHASPTRVDLTMHRRSAIGRARPCDAVPASPVRFTPGEMPMLDR
ncbi:peptidase S53, partial [Xanthomonas oryzae pv. oryzae]